MEFVVLIFVFANLEDELHLWNEANLCVLLSFLYWFPVEMFTGAAADIKKTAGPVL